MDNLKVTVLMPVYNAEKYLGEAIESILTQSFKNFEFLIINDGSTDKSIDVVESFTDQRIHLLHNERNLGLIATLNKGQDMARGEYIARMDSDDISAPVRLEKQVAFMEKNPGVGVCGCWIKNIKKRRSNIWYYPEDNDEIKSDLIFATAFAHPAVIIRKNLFKENNLYYSPDYVHAEDYELWTRAAKYMNFSNIQEALFYYRRHADQVSQTHSLIQGKNLIKASLNMINNNLGIIPTEGEIEIHSSIILKKNGCCKNYLKNVEKWFNRIVSANREARILSEDRLKRSLARRWFAVCRGSHQLGLQAWHLYRKSEFADYNQTGFTRTALLFLRSLVRI